MVNRKKADAGLTTGIEPLRQLTRVGRQRSRTRYRLLAGLGVLVNTTRGEKDHH